MSKPSSVKIVQGDTVYDTVHAAWLSNGQPSQFERYGEFGGALYRVLDTTETYPDFYQFGSLGPTVFSEDSASERPTERGWHILNRRYHYLKAKWKFNGRVKITAPELPNELSPDETA